VAKHAHWLSRQPRPGRVALDDDRWRSPADAPRLPRVLILDNEVPHMARGGGLPRARLMLQALRDWPVTLFPLWSFDDDWTQVYASIPNTVEVMLGQGIAQLEGFLARRRGLYDVLLISRPPNLQALAPLRIRRPELFAGMRLIYDAEALFALREIGELAVKGRALTPTQAQARLDNELAQAQGVDQVVVVSERDARHFRARGHQVAILSHAMPVRRSVPSPKRRAGLVFVGALHPDTPNEDGLLWFVEHVWPRLCTRFPTPPTIEVVGECRSVRIAALASANFRLLGPQADLRPCYDRAKVFIAPVRFAGGVPVKVIEAAAQGIPVVASAILLRQLGWQDGLEIQGARDADAFAHAIGRLLTNDVLWHRQQTAAWVRCEADYHPDDFARQTRALLLANPTREAT
jgi:glycosyltransferase involved in cell wall biosynthesis